MFSPNMRALHPYPESSPQGEEKEANDDHRGKNIPEKTSVLDD